MKLGFCQMYIFWILWEPSLKASQRITRSHWQRENLYYV